MRELHDFSRNQTDGADPDAVASFLDKSRAYFATEDGETLDQRKKRARKVLAKRPREVRTIGPPALDFLRCAVCFCV